jgi:prenyltransferase beta subunit
MKNTNNFFPEISKSIDKGIYFVRKTWESKDEAKGWAEFPQEEGPIVPWGGTADGILCLEMIADIDSNREDLNKIQKSKEWLKSIRNSDYGWGEFSTKKTEDKEKDKSWIEPTCWALIALRKPMLEKDKKFIEQSLQWIIDNQNEKGGWGYWKGCPSRTYPTCMALRVLILFEKKNIDTVTRGIKWLRDNISMKGGWGPLPRDNEPTSPHTAHAIITLTKYGISNDESIIKEAKDVLFRSKKNGLWENYNEENTFELSKSKYRFRTRHFGTPWVLEALLESGEYVFSNTILTGMSYIIEAQDDKDGYWRYNPQTHPSIWSSFNCIMVLKLFLSKAQDVSTILGIRSELISTKEEVRKELRILSGQVTELTTEIGELRTYSEYLKKIINTSIKYGIGIFVIIWSSIFISIMIVSGYYRKIPIEIFVSGLIIPIVASIIAGFLYDRIQKKKKVKI